MRAVFGLVGLVLAVLMVALLARKQLSSVTAPAPLADAPPPAAAPVTPQQQVQQLKQAVEGSLQQARPMPEDSQ